MKNSHLDSDQVNLKAKNSRTAKWDILEKALGDWAVRFDQVHGIVSGDLLRLKASEFWQRLPEYQGLECLSWSEGWLSGFKNRYNFYCCKKVGEASLVEITEDIIT